MTLRLGLGRIGIFAALFTLTISLAQNVPCCAQNLDPVVKFVRLQDAGSNVSAEPAELPAAGAVETNVRCAGNEQMRASLKPLSEINLGITPRGGAPTDCYALDVDSSQQIWSFPPSDSMFEFHWQATGLVHNPLYFEDVPLERYGHGCWPLLQPLVSGAHFWGAALSLPYRIGVDSPHKLQYTLGYHRPGTCAPSVREHLPLSAKGAVLQAGAIVGGVYLFP